MFSQSLSWINITDGGIPPFLPSDRRPGLQPDRRIAREQVRSRVLCASLRWCRIVARGQRFHKPLDCFQPQPEACFLSTSRQRFVAHFSRPGTQIHTSLILAHPIFGSLPLFRQPRARRPSLRSSRRSRDPCRRRRLQRSSTSSPVARFHRCTPGRRPRSPTARSHCPRCSTDTRCN